jgi:hypothetical protein
MPSVGYDAGHKATTSAITHTADGFDQLVARLGRYGGPAGLPVAIERPDGRLVDRRVAANQLGACLEAFWPCAKGVFADLASPIALDLLTRDRRPAYPDAKEVACLAEATPVTKQSGKHTTFSFVAVTTFADNSRHGSPWAKVHADALPRGHDRPHAVRGLAQAWIRLLWRCWIDQVPYDSTKHRTAHKLTAVATSAA